MWLVQDGRIAVEYAQRHGHEDSAKLLESHVSHSEREREREKVRLDAIRSTTERIIGWVVSKPVRSVVGVYLMLSAAVLTLRL